MEVSATEFSRPIPLDRILPRATTYDIEATPAERSAVSARLGLVRIDALSATVTLGRRAAGTVIAVDGVVRARVTQRCVVSLEAFASDVEEPFSVELCEQVGDIAADGGVDIEDSNAPEPVDGDAVDIGELTVQYLSLALDPHPRAPGVMFEAPSQGDAQHRSEETGERNPFAKLAHLKRPE